MTLPFGEKWRKIRVFPLLGALQPPSNLLLRYSLPTGMCCKPLPA